MPEVLVEVREVRIEHVLLVPHLLSRTSCTTPSRCLAPTRRLRGTIRWRAAERARARKGASGKRHNNPAAADHCEGATAGMDPSDWSTEAWIAVGLGSAAVVICLLGAGYMMYNRYDRAGTMKSNDMQSVRVPEGVRGVRGGRRPFDADSPQ